MRRPCRAAKPTSPWSLEPREKGDRTVATSVRLSLNSGKMRNEAVSNSWHGVHHPVTNNEALVTIILQQGKFCSGRLASGSRRPEPQGPASPSSADSSHGAGRGGGAQPALFNPTQGTGNRRGGAAPLTAPRELIPVSGLPHTLTG